MMEVPPLSQQHKKQSVNSAIIFSLLSYHYVKKPLKLKLRFNGEFSYPMMLPSRGKNYIPGKSRPGGVFSALCGWKEPV